MLVVLDVSDGLIEIAVGTDAWRHEAVLYFGQKLFYHRHSVFSNHYSFHISVFYQLVPLVTADIRDGHSSFRVCIQNFLNKVLGALGNESGNQKVAIQDFLVKFACVGIFKRQITTSHCIQNDSAAPNVRVQTMVTLACDHFWSCVAGTSACCFKRFVLLIYIRQAKVYDFDVVLLVEKKVFWFEVSVADAHLVDVLDARNNLLKETTSLVFLQTLAFDDIVEEFSSTCILHDEKKLARGFYNFVQLDHVRVPHYLQNVNFSCNSLHIALVFDFVFFQDFYCHLFSCY